VWLIPVHESARPENGNAETSYNETGHPHKVTTGTCPAEEFLSRIHVSKLATSDCCAIKTSKLQINSPRIQ
jgi:hypothetical protein